MHELFTVGPRDYERVSDNDDDFSRRSAFNRINALGAIKSAEHGWLGASFSATEVLTALYFGAGTTHVALSKGHAAAMQFACLHGLGRLSREALLSYKNGPSAPQAHSDRSTPTVLVTTGSLGQALSKVAGIAMVKPDERFNVILGDGELQEGQIYEALMTLATKKICNVTAIIDRNGFQSTLRIDAVKPIKNLSAVIEGFGLDCVNIDGHDASAVLAAWQSASKAPTVIVANTHKAGGSRYLEPQNGRQPWHGKVPDDQLYLRLLEEQVSLAGDREVQDLFTEFVAQAARNSFRATPTSTLPKPTSTVESTGTAFSKHLADVLDEREELVVLDADLSNACHLVDIEEHPRFYEMGISEQDMVSFAGGLALAGKTPVVNTYAAFYKRAFEQMYVNAIEETRIVYAAHYAGTCYFTDGKTHQSINDPSWANTIPGLVVCEPVLPSQVGPLFDWASTEHDGPSYFRLRRTPCDLPLSADAAAPTLPLTHGTKFSRCFVTMGTVATRLGLDCLRLREFSDWGLITPAILASDLHHDWYKHHLGNVDELITIEEDLAPGALFAFMHALCSRLRLAPKIRSKTLPGFGASFRSLESCLQYFNFTPTDVAAELA